MGFILNLDFYLWLGTIILLLAGVWVVLRRRARRPDPGEYNPEDDWDELDEEWDSDSYGSRPWRPGRKND